MQKILKTIQTYWLLVAIVGLATWLRVYQLDTHAIFFGDAGRDLLVASQAVADRTLPLLGIPSSVPRFHQGPITIWLEMLLFGLVGFQLYPFSLFFACISIAAVIALYEFLTVFQTKKHGLLAAALLAASPLAVAHGRMVYHITPIPLVMILYLWSLIRLKEARSRSLFWAVLAWSFLFQFELALLPLLLIIPYLLWQQKRRLSKQVVIESVAGFGIGLLPQILFDLTHGFKQLGGFAMWVGYRLLSAVSIFGDHAVGPSSLAQTGRQAWLYGTRIVSVDQPLFFTLALGLLAASAVVSWQLNKRHQLPAAMQLTWYSTILLALGFTVHSSPSEAYFPVFCVLLPILISYPLSLLSDKFNLTVWAGMLTWICLMVFSISRNGWFLGQTESFSYGPTITEQRQIVAFAQQLTNDDFQFATLQPGGAFASYFDNLRWLAREVGTREKQDGIPVFVEPKDSLLNTYPTATKVELITRDIFIYE